MPHPLTDRRKLQRLSLRELARLTGVHHLRLLRIEHRQSPARPAELEKLARVLDCTPGELQ